MKKQFISIGMAAVMLCSAMPAVPMMTATVYADTEEPISIYDLLEYEIIDGTSVTITKCVDSVTKIDIPSELEDLPVTSIGEGAFLDCDQLTSVRFPNSLEIIGNGAFCNCKSLESIYLPHVTTIGMSAFSNCTALKSVDILCDLTTIGDEAFSACSSLTSIVIPDGVTTIGMCAFTGCSSLTSATIPDSVTFMGRENLHAFSNCNKLTIYGNAGSYAETFAEEHNIPFVQRTGTLDNGLKYEIIDGTFVTITDCNESVRGELVIPAEIGGLPVRIINEYAFTDCESLTSVIIPDSVNDIGFKAFYDCTKLESATVPDSVTTIGESAFVGCKKLTIYGYAGSYAETYAKEYGIPFAAVSTGTPAVPGDLNGDGEVNLKDVVLLRRYIAGGWNTELNEASADLNGDGSVNLKDAVLLRRFIAGGWNVTL